MISAFQEVDIHGMTKAQAFTAIDAKLRRAKGAVYTLRIIHGYHGGTILRDAIRSHYKNHPQVKRIELGLNPGETDLILKELWGMRKHQEMTVRQLFAAKAVISFSVP